jgi:hypothetical protein
METVTIYVVQMGVEMPAATTGKYAAKRAAEAMGYDPDFEYVLMTAAGTPIDPDEPVAEWHEKHLTLWRPR